MNPIIGTRKDAQNDEERGNIKCNYASRVSEYHQVIKIIEY